MNDNFFIKYQASRMLVDTMDMPPDVELAHRRLCDYVWALDKTPLDDADTLCSIAKIKPHDYVRVRGGLELKGWSASGGSFTHGGVVKTLNEGKEYRAKQDKASRLGVEARKASRNQRSTSGATTGSTIGQPAVQPPVNRRSTDGSTVGQPTVQPSVQPPVNPVTVTVTVTDTVTDTERVIPPPYSPPPSGGLGVRVSKWFHRRDSTKLSPKEAKALREVESLKPSEEDVAQLEAFYSAAIPAERDFRRRDLLTLLNNWNGEIDRARFWKAGQTPTPADHEKGF